MDRRRLAAISAAVVRTDTRCSPAAGVYAKGVFVCRVAVNSGKILAPDLDTTVSMRVWPQARARSLRFAFVFHACVHRCRHVVPCKRHASPCPRGISSCAIRGTRKSFAVSRACSWRHWPCALCLAPLPRRRQIPAPAPHHVDPATLLRVGASEPSWLSCAPALVAPFPHGTTLPATVHRWLVSLLGAHISRADSAYRAALQHMNDAHSLLRQRRLHSGLCSKVCPNTACWCAACLTWVLMHAPSVS